MIIDNFKNNIILFVKIIESIISRFYVIILLLIFILLTFCNNYSENLKRKYILDNIYFINKILIDKIDSISDKISIILNIYDIASLNKQLLQENQKLKSQYINLLNIEDENKELKKILNFNQRYDYNYITAKIISNISGPYRRKSNIYFSQNSNIKKGKMVVNDSGLVGRIIEFGEKTATIMHITDIDSRVPILLTKSREKAIAAGNNSDLLDLLYISKNNNIIDGELVLTTGDSEYFAENIIIGRIVTEDKKYRIKPIVNFSKIDIVSVLN